MCKRNAVLSHEHSVQFHLLCALEPRVSNITEEINGVTEMPAPTGLHTLMKGRPLESSASGDAIGKQRCAE